ncbi:hypothetical protein ACONUD_02755 [Microbulbifer harenosus]|uniref:ASCH domain-containing protein n=1 Tax=Microbulbifer harenosus TaxID=2576840 RepID=A0ABY2UCX9_9GAMM|nr:hypothetical protein [Microbulbifer harenosus]TLM73424.1 hypothetical protein FDY93_18905 [Microbulbifer harenosus]
MNLDLDNLTIGSFVLGAEFHGKNQIFQGVGYSVSVHKKIVANIHINFGTKIPKSLVFNDCIILNGEICNIDVNTGCREIETLLGPPQEQWEDDYAKNYRYLYKTHELEFNWLVDKDHLEYLSIDLV